VLIERRPAFDIPGVGLGQPANALRVYDTLGVLDEVLTTASATTGCICSIPIAADRRAQIFDG